MEAKVVEVVGMAEVEDGAGVTGADEVGGGVVALAGVEGAKECWNLLSVARRPTGVNNVDSRVTRGMANSSVNQASHGHCAGVFIGT